MTPTHYIDILMSLHTILGGDSVNTCRYVVSTSGLETGVSLQQKLLLITHITQKLRSFVALYVLLKIFFNLQYIFRQKVASQMEQSRS